MADPKDLQGLDFQLIEETYDPISHSRRGLAGFAVNKYGRAQSNVESAETFMKFVENHYADTIDPFRCNVILGANPKKGLVALYPAVDLPKGSTALNWAADRKTFSLHLGAVLRKYPQLRPSTTVEALLQETVDADGRPCLVVKLHGALPKRKLPTDPTKPKVTRKRKGGTPEGGTSTPAPGTESDAAATKDENE